MHEKHLLSNVRVIEVAAGWVGPGAGQLLADLGAEVIKVESITIPDFNRGVSQATDVGGSLFYANYPGGKLGERPWNRNSLFNAASFNKYGVTLDLTKPRGLDLFMQLMKQAELMKKQKILNKKQKNKN